MQTDLQIGLRQIWTEEVPVFLTATDRRRHLYVIGQTATGKSTLLRNLISQDIVFGNGCALVDPHGDLANEVLDCIPGSRIDDVVIVDPSDTEHPVGFNPFFRVAEGERSLVAANLTSTFKHIWRDSWGPRLEYILFNTIAALLEAPDNLRPTFLSIPRVLVELDYREAVVRNVGDPRVRSFFRDEFARWNDRQLEERLGSVQNKIGQFLSSPSIRNIFGQWNPSVKLDEIMRRKRILIVRLSKGLVGEEPANLLGSFIVTGLTQAAMRRADISKMDRNDFHLYVDEFHNFTTDTFTTVLSEARKYGLTIICANQYIQQLAPDISEAVFGNVGNIISFRVSAGDAERMAQEINGFHPRVFRDLETGEVCVRLLQALNPALVSRLRIEPHSSRIYKVANTARKQSQQRYGMPRKKVEDRISGWFQNR